MERLDIGEVVERLTRGQSLAGTDLMGLDLSGMDLKRADLRGALLVKTKLVETDLGGADLAGAWLEGANLLGTVAEGAQMGGVNLHGADLSSARLAGAEMSAADLTRAMLVNTDLSGTRLVFADLSGATLLQTRLEGALLQEADLSDAKLALMDLGGANLSGINLMGAELQQVSGLVLPSRTGSGGWARGSELGLRAVGPDQRSPLGAERGRVLRDVEFGLRMLVDQKDLSDLDGRRCQSLLRRWLDQVLEVRGDQLSFELRGARTLLGEGTAPHREMLVAGWRRMIDEQRRHADMLDVTEDIARLERHLTLFQEAERAAVAPRSPLAQAMKVGLEEGRRKRRELRFPEETPARALGVLGAAVEEAGKEAGIEPDGIEGALLYLEFWVHPCSDKTPDGVRFDHARAVRLAKSAGPAMVEPARLGMARLRRNPPADESLGLFLDAIHEALEEARR